MRSCLVGLGSRGRQYSWYAIVKMSICRLTFTVGHYYGMSPEHNFEIFPFSCEGLRAQTTNNQPGQLSQPSWNLNEICLTDFLQFHFLNLIHDPLGLLFSQKIVGQIFQSKGFSRKTEITAISYSSSHPISQRGKLSLSPHSLTLQAPVIVEAFCKRIAIIFRISFTAPHLPSC